MGRGDDPLSLGLTITMESTQAEANEGEATRFAAVGTTDTDLGTTDARLGAEALGVKLDGFRSKAHTKAGTSCMRDS